MKVEKLISGDEDIFDKAFNFREFFRVWTGDIEYDKKEMPQNANVGEFVHENDVVSFLNLICKKDDYSNYPYFLLCMPALSHCSHHQS